MYSAVLSAFTIESYQNLQPDTKDEIVFVLRHMATQSYTFNAGFLNATAPIPDLPPFEPPLWAVRVNVLWFASLVFSLAAASLGMLVKQWLREFLAMEYTSPQQRLRARQYREPSLKTWKVYEIAAVLPLLLQIALGLFFVGLCYFTAQVHSNVANTTLPLVCGWVFFFVMTTVAPLASPRCPFKTTLLKDAMRSSRRHSFDLIRECTKVHIVVDESAMSRVLKRCLSNLLPYLRAASAAILRTTRSSFGGITGALRKLLITLDQAQQTRLDVLLVRKPEENEVIQKESEDTEMLLAVDSVMPGNTFLPTILDAYRSQNLRDVAATSRFVLSLVRNRTLTAIDPAQAQLNVPPDLRALSERDWESLLDTVSDIPLEPTNGPVPSWAINSLLIVLSESRYNLRQKDVGFLSRYMTSGLLPHALRHPEFCPEDPARKAELLVRMVQHCAGEETLVGTLTRSMNLRGLEDKAWQSVATAAADILQSNSKPIGPRSQPWIHHIVHLLLSHTGLHLPSSTKQALATMSFDAESLKSFLRGMHLDSSDSTNGERSPELDQVHRFLTHCVLDRPVTVPLDLPVDLTSVHPSIWEVVVSTVFEVLEGAARTTDASAPRESPPSWIKEATMILLSAGPLGSQMPSTLLESLRRNPGLARLILQHGAHFLLLEERTHPSPARSQILRVSAEVFSSTTFRSIPDLSDFGIVQWQSLVEYVARELLKTTSLNTEKSDQSWNRIDVLLSRSTHPLLDTAGEALTTAVTRSTQPITSLFDRHSDHSKNALPRTLHRVIRRLFEAEAVYLEGQSNKSSGTSILNTNKVQSDRLVATWLPRFHELISNPTALIYSFTTLLTYLQRFNGKASDLPVNSGPINIGLLLYQYSQITPPPISVENWKRVVDEFVPLLDKNVHSLSTCDPIPIWLLHSIMILLSVAPEDSLHCDVIRVTLQTLRRRPELYKLLGANIHPLLFALFRSRFFQLCGSPDVLEGCLRLYTSALCKADDHTHSSLAHLLDAHEQSNKDETHIADSLFQLLLDCSQRMEFSWYGERRGLSRQILFAISALSTQAPERRDQAVKSFIKVFGDGGRAVLLQLITVNGNEEPCIVGSELYVSAFAESYQNGGYGSVNQE